MHSQIKVLDASLTHWYRQLKHLDGQLKQFFASPKNNLNFFTIRQRIDYQPLATKQ